jgi:hypothetical protein
MLLSANCAGCHNVDGSGGKTWPGPNIRNKTRTMIAAMVSSPTDHPGGSFDAFTQSDIANLESYLADGGSGARPDGVPDSCQAPPDCDEDGIFDACELGSGDQVDLDWNGVPDACEATSCSADLDGNSTVDGMDLSIVLASWATDGAGDINGDGTTDGIDLAQLLGTWGVCAP